MASDASSSASAVEARTAEIVGLVQGDLKDIRALLQRQLALEETLTGLSVTIAAGMLGLAFSNKEPILAWMAVPLLLLLAYFAGRTAVHRRRAAGRAGELERLMHLHLVVLRETGRGRERSWRRWVRELDRYTFGTEATIEAVSIEDVWRVTRKSARQWFYVVLIAVALVSGTVLWLDSASDNAATTCLTTADGSVIQLEALPMVLVGEATIAACPDSAEPPSEPVDPTGPDEKPSTGQDESPSSSEPLSSGTQVDTAD